ncbi:hypothetical protein VXN63_09250 [Marinilactibacillus sp. XAAS-LB27]|uniref:hypothetical protein n=1 Tax=Marinilactibacillus sp. XAAS-LB27 TaxID=3114538 RepID=UPI002E18F095|nr:hypothetical protein [Marinilactibacillus sp. XAAS-LB27]
MNLNQLRCLDYLIKDINDAYPRQIINDYQLLFKMGSKLYTGDFVLESKTIRYDYNLSFFADGKLNNESVLKQDTVLSPFWENNHKSIVNVVDNGSLLFAFLLQLAETSEKAILNLDILNQCPDLIYNVKEYGTNQTFEFISCKDQELVPYTLISNITTHKDYLELQK